MWTHIYWKKKNMHVHFAQSYEAYISSHWWKFISMSILYVTTPHLIKANCDWHILKDIIDKLKFSTNLFILIYFRMNPYLLEKKNMLVHFAQKLWEPVLLWNDIYVVTLVKSHFNVRIVICHLLRSTIVLLI